MAEAERDAELEFLLLDFEEEELLLCGLALELLSGRCPEPPRNQFTLQGDRFMQIYQLGDVAFAEDFRMRTEVRRWRVFTLSDWRFCVCSVVDFFWFVLTFDRFFFPPLS